MKHHLWTIALLVVAVVLYTVGTRGRYAETAAELSVVIAVAVVAGELGLWFRYFWLRRRNRKSPTAK